MARSKAPESAPPSPAPESRTVATGVMIEYRERAGRRHDAVILRVYPDGTSVDVAYYDEGYPLTARGVEHAAEGGENCWNWPGEAPPPKPTLEQVLAAAEARGERVPRIGMVVAFVQDDGDMIRQKLTPYRAVIRDIAAPNEVTVDVYLDDSPRFGDPDEPLFRRQHVRHAVGGVNAWCYLDELPKGLSTAFPEVDRIDLQVPWPCDACGARVKRHTLTEIKAGLHSKRVCVDCMAKLVGLPPGPAPAATS